MGNKASKTKIPKGDLDTLLKTTSFSEKQIKEWYKGFVRDCPDGTLSRNKFLDTYLALFPDGKAKNFYEHVFRTFDQDDSGSIDFMEFLQAISITQAGKPEDKLELAFRLYDIDRNGTIEENEMVEVIKAIYLMVDEDAAKTGEAPLNRTKQIFDKMDENQDGVLSKEEFMKGCMNDQSLYRLLACTNEMSGMAGGGDAGDEAS